MKKISSFSIIKLLWCSSILIEVFLCLLPVIFNLNPIDYLYPSLRSFSLKTIGTTLIALLAVACLNIVLVFWYRYCKYYVSNAVVIVILIAMVLQNVFAAGVCVVASCDYLYESRTSDVDNFGVFDAGVSLDFDDLKENDFVRFDKDEIKSYSYRYYTPYDVLEYEIDYTVELSSYRFSEIYLLLLTESSFVDNGDGIVGEIKMANALPDDVWGGTSIFYDRNNGQMRFLFKYHHGD